jgi:uncharacterized membrane protein YbhN (UPF0104 family)
MFRGLDRPVMRAVIKGVVSIALLVWLARNISGAGLWARAATTDWRLVGLVLLIQTLLPILVAERWRAICRRLNTVIRPWRALENIYIGQFFNQVLPSAIGGDAVRLWQLVRWDMPLGTALASIMLDRLVALFAVPLMLLLGFGIVAGLVPGSVLGWLFAILTGGTLAGLALLLSIDRLVPPALAARSAILRKLNTISRVSREVFLSPACVGLTLLLSVAIHVGVGVSLWLLTRGLQADVPLAPFLVLTPIVVLVIMLPISLGGWGVREGALITALSFMHVPSEVALLVSVQFGLIMIAVGLPGGALWLVDSDRYRIAQPSLIDGQA